MNTTSKIATMDVDLDDIVNTKVRFTRGLHCTFYTLFMFFQWWFRLKDYKHEILPGEW